ncbi:amidase signature enzyme [Cytidiella melzeri]|nr:amidase signature enzyme [Cytidiella melzeri]
MVISFHSQHKAACKQKQREIADKTASFTAQYATPLTDDDHRVLKLSLAELADKCSNGELNPTTVLDAYSKRCLAAHDATNCLADVMFDEALSTYAPNRPLSGVPVSLKDVVDIEGHDTTIGFSAKANKPVATPAAITRLLRDAGALIHVKTTVPIGLLSFETTSDLFGETTNPYNPQFSPGGSTGGGAALLAYRGSKIEIATDVGGSVRFPPAFCGLYGMRPSTGRFPSMGCQTCAPGLEGIETAAPIAKDIDDLREFWERVIGMKPWDYDHSCLPIPWRPVDFVLAGRKPKWGIIWSDGLIAPTPACKRALEVARDALLQQGYDVVDFDPPSPVEGLKIGFPLTFAEGGVSVQVPISPGEKMGAAIVHLLTVSNLPKFVKWIMATCLRWFSRPAGRNDVFADLITCLHAQTVAQERALVVRREKYKAAWKQAMKKQEIDFVLSPIHALPPMPKHGSGVATLVSANYAFLYNILDYTAGVVPAAFVDRELDALPENLMQTERYAYLNDAERAVWSLYDANAMHGLPLSVQVIGGQLQEEKVLEGMKQLETALRESGRPFIQKEF